jgi:Xaa-Pro aminopeptidase
MKSDIDALMAKRGLDAMLIVADEIYNPPLDYMMNEGHVTTGLMIKLQGAQPVLYVSSMETEEAARSGYEVHVYNDPRLVALVQEHRDISRGHAAWWGEILAACGLAAGRVGVYGAGDFSFILGRVSLLGELCPQYQFVGETVLSGTLFDEAFATKGPDELERLRSVAERTDLVMQQTWDWLTGHHAEGGLVVAEDGHTLTIGRVKRFVRRALLDVELEDTAMIFAQGRDAGFPHSRGRDDEALKLGQAIVFDLFPRELGGGYFHDMTRTWSLGYATPEVQAAYDEVMTAFDIAIETIKPGMPANQPQLAVLDYFEGRGHQTLRTHPGTQQGYVHSLGHGIGLNIHEAPGMSHLSTATLAAGNVITVEPGLYYPEKGFGVRIEDACIIEADGQVTPLTRFRKDLVLPIASR